MSAADGSSSAIADLVYLLHDPAGTPVNRKIRLDQLIAAFEISRHRWDFVRDFGADASGATDQSLVLQGALQTIADAGGGKLYCPPGVYKISHALQDASVSNAQVILPSIGNGHVFGATSAQVCLVIEGALPAPTDGVSTASPAAGYTYFTSTLTGAALTACMIGHPFTGAAITNSNNLQTVWRNLIFQMPSNPTLSCLNLGNGNDCQIDGVMIFTGNTPQNDVVQPTHNNAAGIILPYNNTASMPSVRNSIVFGMYYGVLISELAQVESLVCWSCYVGVLIYGSYHANRIGFLGTYECPYGIKSAPGTIPTHGGIYLTIQLWDIENSNGSYQSWQDSVYNVDDSGNDIHGSFGWHAVDGGFGTTHTLVKNGGTNFSGTEV